MKNKNILSGFCSKTVLYVFGVLSIWIFEIRVLNLSNLLARGGIPFWAISLGIFGLLLIVLYQFNWVNEKLKKLFNRAERLSGTQMMIMLFLISLLTKTAALFLFQIDSSMHPDCGEYWSFIKQLTNEGLITENAGYAARFSYTVIYSTFYLPFTKVFGTGNILYLNFYLIILFSICSLLLFDVIRMYRGKVFAFWTNLIWLLVPIGITEPLMIVHENGLVVLHIIAIWLFFRLRRTVKSWGGKMLCILAAAVVISYAARFNQFGLISISAFCLELIFTFLRSEYKKKEIFTLFLTLCIFGGCYMASGRIVSSYAEKRIDSQTSFDGSKQLYKGWTLFVGANYETKGIWSADDVARWGEYEKIEDQEEALDYQRSMLSSRYRDLTSSPWRVLSHLNNKMSSIWGEFNPVMYDMGNGFNKFLLSSHIQYVLNIFFLLIDILMSFVMMLSFAKDKQSSAYIEYLKMFIIGVTLILLVVEVMPKYSSHMLFAYIVIMADGWGDFSEKAEKISIKLNRLIKIRG